MPSYTFTGAGVYPVAGGAQIGASLPGGTIDDGQQGPAFTTNGPGPLNPSVFTVGGQTVNYAGTVTAGANTFPAGVFTTGPLAGNLIVFFEGVPVPPTLPGAALSQGAAFQVCFAAGTEIATPEGITLVEDLKIGDMVRTFDGRDVAVKWVGRQTVSLRFAPAERLLPVKIRAGALGADLPTKDLIVTADHALLIGDTLCNAGALVNGTTIARASREEMGERFTVYHVETENHEVILANGVAAETYIDNVARTAFDNFAEFAELYGAVAEMKELAYPRAMSERQVPAAIRAALAGEVAA
jgi:hypothetical protein